MLLFGFNLKRCVHNLFPFRRCRVKRRNARRNKNINILNTEFKRTAKINNLEVAQVNVCIIILLNCSN